MSVYASIDDLRSQLGGVSGGALSPEYREKQLHTLPEAKSVDRVEFILEHCKGKRVLEFGASGPLHEAIVKVAAWVWGVDRTESDGVNGFDLDDVSQARFPEFNLVTTSVPVDQWGDKQRDAVLHEYARLDLIVCGEVLEHLGNPLHFLTRLKRQYTDVPVIITVPNAFSKASQHWIAKGIENVNKDHVAWYSPKTLSVLLERAGFTVGGLFWYGGDGPTAEGLVVVTE